MGVKATFKCNKCGNDFVASSGGTFFYARYRCAECDATKDVPRGLCSNSVPGSLKCPRCGGELRDDLGPMCPKCKSRDIEEKDILELYD